MTALQTRVSDVPVTPLLELTRPGGGGGPAGPGLAHACSLLALFSPQAARPRAQAPAAPW